MTFFQLLVTGDSELNFHLEITNQSPRNSLPLPELMNTPEKPSLNTVQAVLRDQGNAAPPIPTHLNV